MSFYFMLKEQMQPQYVLAFKSPSVHLDCMERAQRYCCISLHTFCPTNSYLHHCAVTVCWYSCTDTPTEGVQNFLPASVYLSSLFLYHSFVSNLSLKTWWSILYLKLSIGENSVNMMQSRYTSREMHASACTLKNTHSQSQSSKHY